MGLITIVMMKKQSSKRETEKFTSYISLNTTLSLKIAECSLIDSQNYRKLNPVGCTFIVYGHQISEPYLKYH
jgi:hypothetical protein